MRAMSTAVLFSPSIFLLATAIAYVSGLHRSNTTSAVVLSVLAITLLFSELERRRRREEDGPPAGGFGA